jgi:hypothetical protein
VTGKAAATSRVQGAVRQASARDIGCLFVGRHDGPPIIPGGSTDPTLGGGGKGTDLFGTKVMLAVDL